jgi:ATP-dependent DNA ligase
MCLLPLPIIELGATQKAARIAPSDPERRQAKPGLQLNEHITVAGDVVFRHACALGLDGIVSKKLGSRYVSGRSQDWLKFKNHEAPAVKREFEETSGNRRAMPPR